MFSTSLCQSSSKRCLEEFWFSAVRIYDRHMLRPEWGGHVEGAVTPSRHRGGSPGSSRALRLSRPFLYPPPLPWTSCCCLLLVLYACSLPCLHVQGCKPIFFLNKSFFADEIPSQRFVYSWHGCGAFWYTYIAHGACLFNCSTTNGCSGCFPFGAIKNKASLILNVVWLTYTHVFLAYIPRSGIVVS